MQKVKFYLKPRRDQNAQGLSLVYLSLRIDGNHEDINLECYVPGKNWDYKARTLKGGKGLTKLEALEMMADLERILERVKGIWQEARTAGETLSHSDFEKRLKHKQASFNFIDFCRGYATENPRKWKKGTKRIYEDSIGWLETVFGSTITLNDISKQTHTNFYESFEKGMKADLGSNTRKKHHKHVKFFLKRARLAGYSFRNPYEDESIGRIKGNRNYLNAQELEQALNYYHAHLLDNNLQETLRQFLFCCFTGPRYGDAQELGTQHLVGQELHYIAQKTENYEIRVEVPIPDVARRLIAARTSGKLFTHRTSNVTNRYLKTIFKEIGINKSISFHCARHTFGTLYIYLGGDLFDLKQLMGHRKIDTTQIYVHMASRMNAKCQDVFDKEFKNKLRVITNSRWAKQEAS